MGRPSRNSAPGKRSAKAAEPLYPVTENERFALDASYRREGAHLLAGVDEAGRGPLAGPVVAAAVILPDERPAGLEGLNDSKQVSPALRERLYEVIVQCAVSHGIAVIEPEVIDRINILQATWLAMREAIVKLGRSADLLLVDGNPVQGLPFPQQNLVKGDSRSASIAAASILAKVTRDRIMCQLDPVYPAYGFASHKGYGSAYHLAALEIFGPCDIHRKSFLPVRESLFSTLHTGPSDTFLSCLNRLNNTCDALSLADLQTNLTPLIETMPASEALYLEEALRRKLRREEMVAEETS